VGSRPTRRQALYFPSEMLEELQKESKRQDRSISWLIQQAWRVGRIELRKMPSTTDFIPQVEYDSSPDDPGKDPER
jgi:uncharacterized small protein (TIGR04563 family)